MKKSPIPLLCLLLFSGLLSAQNLPAYLPSNGLVGWWPFNGNANDESGNGNDGIMYGVSPANDRNGNSNRAFGFNGIDNYIKVPNSNSFQFSGSLTVSAWVKANFLPVGAFSSTSYILSKGQDGGEPQSWCFNWDTDGIGCNVYQNNGVDNCGPRLFYSQYQYQLNTWYYVTLVFNGSNGRFYLNGELKSTIPCSISNFSNAFDLTIGRKALSGNPYFFNGYIDDVAIYNRVLTQQEITNLFQAGTETANCLPSYVPTAGLLGYYPFCGNANDESGNGNNATTIQATLTSDRYGVFGKAYDFNGINSKIICPISNIPTGNDPSSISLWFKTRIFPFPADTSRAMVSWGGWSTNAARYLGLRGASNNLLTYAQYLNDVNMPFNYQLNEWYHLAAVYSSDSIKLYVNGSKIGSALITGANTTAGPLIFGNSPGFTDGFNGIIDDAAIYNRPITEQEIKSLFQGGNTSCPTVPTNLQQGLVGYWPFCGNANDESGNVNNGTIYGATLATDRFGNAGKAYYFDGNARIKTPINSSTLNLNRSLSLVFWTKQSNFQGDNQVFIWRGDSQGGFDPYGFCRCGDQFAFRRNVGTDGQLELVEFPKNQADSDNWIHLAGTFDSTSSKMRIYLNGQLMAERIVPTPIQYSSAGFITQFGGVEDYPGLLGSLDDIAIWDRALSAEEISQLYEVQSCSTPLLVSITGTSIVTAAPGSSIQIQATANSDSTRWQWQAQAAEMGWTNLPANNRYQKIDSARLKVNGLTLANHQQEFRVIAKSGGCSDTSSTVLLDISDTCITSINDTSFVTVSDTSFITIYDTNTTTIYDTNLVTVTDTLLINTIITAGNPGIRNTLKAYPNPTAGMLYINTGNFSTMTGYSIRISSASGQLVYESAINQALLEVPLDSFGANGLYYLRLYKPSGELVTTRKIVLQQ